MKPIDNNKLNFISEIFLLLILLNMLLFSNNVYADQQILSTRDVLPKTNAELKLDESFKTNLFTGSFIYDYKIDIPQGTNNLQPEISLFYTSQKSTAPPSVLGTGWDFTESYIERDTNSSFNDTENDKFILVLNQNNYHLIYISSENQFRTETEPSLKIENTTTNTNKKGMYWNVKAGDGINYRFGFNNDSESIYDNGNYTVRWYLDTIIDTYNNSIFYNYVKDPYDNDANATYLMNISYNNDRTRIIYFEYEDSDRGDVWKIYQNGNNIRYSRRLNRIVITANGNIVRKYVIEYKNSDSITRNYISSVKQYGSDNVTNLPETSFSYYPVLDGFTDNSVWYPPVCVASTSGHGDQGTRLEDLNGDGLVDIIKALSTNGPCNIPDQLKAFINNGSGWVENTSWYPPICFYSYFTGDVGTRVVDVNGDGRADIIKGYNTNTECDTVSEADAYINNGNGWTRNTSWNPPICFYSSMHGDEGVQLVDINGDSLVDIVRGYTDVGGSCENPNNATAFINNGTGWVRNNSWKPPVCFSSAGMEDEGSRFADVNGDGLVDIIRGRDSSGPCENPDIQSAYINTGNGWIQSSVWNPPVCFVSDPGNDEGTRLADINGDNRIDIIRSRIQSSNNNCELPDLIQAYLNNGNGWTLNTTWYPPTCFTQYGVQFPDQGTRLTDVNGDGLVDIIRGLEHYDCNPPDERKAFVNNGNQSYLLKEIRNSFGGSLTIDYKKSTSVNNMGSDNIGDLGFNLWVVSSITQRNGINGSAGVNTTYIYNYSGGKYDYQEREFQGFSFAAETRQDNTKFEHYFYQDKPRTGREYKSEVFNANSLYQRKGFLWNYTVNETSSGRLYVTKLGEENTSFLDGLGGEPRVTRTTYSYDQFGNVIEKAQLGEASIGDEKYERYNYTYNTTAWIIDKPKSYALIASDNITKLREINYTYDNLSYGDPPRKGSITKKEELAGAVTRYAYNDHGNMISLIDPNNHETQYTYGATDATFTFPDQQINAKGHTTKYTYNLGFGKLTSINDSNGFVTNYTYDTFGRISKEIRPYDSEAYPTKQYTYEIDGVAPEKIKVLVREQNSINNTFDSYQFYDGFSNFVLTKSEAADAKQIATDTLYDKVTRPEIKSNPHLLTFNENYTEPDLSINRTNFTYDPIDRISIITNPDKTTKFFNYTKWNVTITDENGNKQLQVLDAYGRIKEVHEYNGDEIYVTLYYYDDTDNLIKITDNEGNNFTFSYDLLGRKTGMSDPDMGVWNYTYDGAGNLISQKDNRNITTDFYYDELNRLTRRNSSIEFFNFMYDVGLNGTLSGVKGVDFIANFTYDNRLRKLSETKNITSNITVINFSYDSMDRIVQVLLPNNYTINLTYNDQNQIESIAGTVDNIDYNELNNVLRREYNNTLVSDFNYTPDNLRLRRIKTSSTTTTLQELNYTYDNASNIVQINDTLHSRIYTMKYDNLSRLLNATRIDNSTLEYIFRFGYSSIGNILGVVSLYENTTYAYGQKPVHAPHSVNKTTLPSFEPQIIYPNGGETINELVLIRWTESTDPENMPISYEIDYTNNSGTAWHNIVSDYGIIRIFNDSSPTKQFIFIENQNISVFIDIPKNTTVTKGTLRLSGNVEPNNTTAALWHLDEGSGTIAHDETGINNATFSGNPLWSTDTQAPDSSYSLNFSGSDYLNSTDSLSLSITGDITVEAWIKPMNPTASIAQGIVAKWNDIGTNARSYMLYLDGNGKAVFEKSSDGQSEGAPGKATGTTILESYRWYHVKGTFNSSSKEIKIYVNGTLEATTTSGSSGIYDNAEHLLIGSAKAGGTSQQYFYGLIDEVRIRNSIKQEKFPTNTTLEIGNPDGIYEWNHTGEFIETETTPDFSQKLDSVAQACTCTLCVSKEAVCTVPFTFHSDTNGILEADNLSIELNVTSYMWNTTNLTTGSQYKVRIRSTNGAYNSEYDESNNTFSIRTLLDVSNLTELYINKTVRIFEFLVTNRYNETINNIAWAFSTGQSNITSQINASLEVNETMFDYIYYNYTSSGIYTVTATVNSGQFTDSISIQIAVEVAAPAPPSPSYNFTYDANGNLIQDNEFYYEYNNFNQLARVRENNSIGTVIEEYLYDHEGNRIMKKNLLANETTFYISENFIRVSNSSGVFDTVYYYDEKDLVARKDPDGKKFFYHPDHLGSTTLITDESGDVVEETTYEPYGKIIEGGDDRFLYTGKELDKSTNLEYYGARYYSPELGRFVEPDSNLPNVYDPQQLNRYSYVRNNPLKYTDKDGKMPTLAIGAITAGVFAGIEMYYQWTQYGEIRSWENVGAMAAGGFAFGATLGLATPLVASGSAIPTAVGYGLAGTASAATTITTEKILKNEPLEPNVNDLYDIGKQGTGDAFGNLFGISTPAYSPTFERPAEPKKEQTDSGRNTESASTTGNQNDKSKQTTRISANRALQNQQTNLNSNLGIPKLPGVFNNLNQYLKQKDTRFNNRYYRNTNP